MVLINSLSEIVKANVETLDQGISFLKLISPDIYQSRSNTSISSTIGEHFRHLLDTYYALVDGCISMEVNFNYRRRGASIETEHAQALSELHEIKQWLYTLDVRDEQSLNIVTEIAIKQTCSISLQSSLARELVFTSFHAIHHYALIAAIARYHGVEVDSNLGVAPATATFQRYAEATH